MSENIMTDIFPKELPLFVTRGAILFPSTVKTIYIEREISVNAYHSSINEYESYCIITAQKDFQKSEIDGLEDIYEYGALCRIISSNNDSKSTIRARINALERVKIDSIIKENNFFKASVSAYEDVFSDEKIENQYVKTLVESINKYGPNVILKAAPENYKSFLSRGITALNLGYLVSDIIDVKIETKVELLSAKTVNDRLIKLIAEVEKIGQGNEIEKRIQETIRINTEKNQKEYYLREKIRAIQKELGDDVKQEDNLEKELNNNPYPKEVKEKISAELKRMQNMPQGSLEASLIKDYIDIVMDVPWFKETQDKDDIKNVLKVLDEDHYGLKKVKERIVEYLAVKKVNGNLKAPILCFYGPPGCGKTSLSKSIARALGREFIKCSLGGVSDEAEIRGHRRTYVGSRPGRIINSLRKAKVKNPVFLLDEIDKLGSNYKGDPSSALLEVLDPEQNNRFNDNYLELDYDLSNVLFVCTANDLGNIPAPLMDRLELIEVDSYTLLDKTHIAREFLIPKEMQANGVNLNQVEFTDEALIYIIERYTRESGVRDLGRRIASVLRKVVVQLLNNKIKEKLIITPKEVRKFLGIEDFDPTNKEKGKQIGVVTGLAWTPFGGDILPIEVNYFSGKGRLILTGKLGDVMKESCEIALDYIKANASKFDIDSKIFGENDIHIHIPEGAVKKDGPSAGCAITTAMVSALTKKPVSGDIAMTGEVTLRGNAIAIGGLREKTLAALRSGIKTVIVPKDNKKAIAELPKEIKDNLKIIYMTTVDEAIKECLG